MCESDVDPIELNVDALIQVGSKHGVPEYLKSGPHILVEQAFRPLKQRREDNRHDKQPQTQQQNEGNRIQYHINQREQHFRDRVHHQEIQ